MKNVPRSISIGFFVIVLLSFGISSAYAKTFRGRVIDADTKEPIEGAVVVAEWMTEIETPTATHTDLKDVKECLTDKNGKWSITGRRGRDNGQLFIPYTKEPQFIVFKPGYCPWPIGFEIDACRNRIKIIGGKDEELGEGGTLELPKLTNREDRLYAQGVRPDSWDEIVANKQKAKKIKNFLRLLNGERKRLGLDEYPIWKEIQNEK